MILSVPFCPYHFVPYHFVIEPFYMLDSLRPTTEGYDKIPAWYLRILAPVCAPSLCHIINISLSHSYVPPQWKTTVIRPVPKIKNPTAAADFRPISVPPILSRMVERIVEPNSS